MKHIIKPALSLFFIATIITTLLAFSYNRTLEPIAAQIRKMQEKTMKEIMPEASGYREIPVEKTGNIVRVFEGLKGGEITGYVIELAPPGYSGAINMMAGISKAENKITGMRVLRHTETPGLGALAVKENFYRKFDGKNLTPLKVVKNSPGADEIEAMTGATITTRAITNAVNEAIEWYNIYEVDKEL
ncbi:MAG: RnfABCDGE type electron transport complex subunit G [Treponema sp.]|jgi:electron transport complex protein RnfG|nr:RnfABCDGE type electron transport complex subunit G [Treponema sp.]